MSRLLAALAGLAFVAAAPSVRGATYYVAEGDGEGDGSTGSPWRSLQLAAESVGAGDTVIVRAGNYAGFDLDGRSGGELAPITFRGEPGASITEDNDRGDGINVENAAWIVIEGFTVNGRSRAGIRCAGSQHVTIRQNTTDGNGRWGIFTGFCDDLLIEGNLTSHSHAEHGIYVSNSAKRYVVRNNHSFGNAGCGIHNNGDLETSRDMGGDGINAEALIEGNVIHDNGAAAGGAGINCDGVQDSVIRNNLLYDNHATGIVLYQIDGGDASKNNLIVNNTIVQAEDGRWGIGISGDGDSGAASGNRVLNNIVYNRHPFRGSIVVSANSVGTLTSDHNVVMDRLSPDGDETILTLDDWRSETGLDVHSRVATPEELFVEPDGEDYHLEEGCPAVDAGTSTDAPPLDLENHVRPAGEGFDVGAYEYGSVLVSGGAEPQPGAGTGDGSGGSGDGSGSGGDGSPTSGSGGSGAAAPRSGGCQTAAASAPVLGTALLAAALGRRRCRCHPHAGARSPPRASLG